VSSHPSSLWCFGALHHTHIEDHAHLTLEGMGTIYRRDPQPDPFRPDRAPFSHQSTASKPPCGATSSMLLFLCCVEIGLPRTLCVILTWCVAPGMYNGCVRAADREFPHVFLVRLIRACSAGPTLIRNADVVCRPWHVRWMRGSSGWLVPTPICLIWARSVGRNVAFGGRVFALLLWSSCNRLSCGFASCSAAGGG
jgi:hypothetical protein